MYLQVASILRNQIFYKQISGKLPTIRELAEQYDINFKTANRAVGILVDEGLVKRIRGKGTFTADQADVDSTVATVGLVLSDVLNPNFARLAEAIQQRAFRKRLSVLVSSNGRDRKRFEAILRMFREQGIQALVVQGGAVRTKACRDLLESVDVPIIGDHTHRDDIDDVWLDVRAGAQMAVQHLIDRFGGPVAFISGSDEEVTRTGRFKGYRDAMLSSGMDIDMRFVRRADPTYTGGRTGVSGILSEGLRPRSVFLYNLVMAMGANTAIRDAGLSIPTNIGVAGCDDSVSEDEMIVPTTTVTFSYDEEARQILRLVQRRLSLPDSEPMSVRIPPALLVRESTTLANP